MLILNVELHSAAVLPGRRRSVSIGRLNLDGSQPCAWNGIFGSQIMCTGD